MNIPFGISRGLTAAALIGLIIMAVLGFLAQERDLEGLRASSQESIFWDASQSEAELARFVAILGRYAVGDESVSAADVNQRFDILWSRVTLLEEGDVGRRLGRYDAHSQVIPELRSLLDEHEQTIVNLSRPVETEKIHRLLADFSEADEQLRQLSLEVLHSEEGRHASVRDHVRASARLTWGVSMAALMLALLLIGIMLIETRRYRRMADESAESAGRAEAASQAKSRFLTMMSHELRTPMNGVLGILALVRQTPLTERQQRLMARAERTGRHMSALLGDILDFSDLQSERLSISSEAFQLQSLGTGIEETFGPTIRREGVAFGIEIAPDAPRRVIGDPTRLRQAIGHFVAFFVEIVGSRDVRVRMTRAGDGVGFAIEAVIEDGDGPVWPPETMFDRGKAEYGNFASDALGPMIARGLVTLMGGSIELNRATPDRVVLSISLPLRVADTFPEHVRIEADSVTLQIILAALLRKIGCEIWEPGRAPGQVTAVLMEAGFPEETAKAARLRSEHPSARLIAIGEPVTPALFDCVCIQPLTAEELSEQLGKVRAADREVC